MYKNYPPLLTFFVFCAIINSWPLWVKHLDNWFFVAHYAADSKNWVNGNGAV